MSDLAYLHCNRLLPASFVDELTLYCHGVMVEPLMMGGSLATRKTPENSGLSKPPRALALRARFVMGRAPDDRCLRKDRVACASVA